MEPKPGDIYCLGNSFYLVFKDGDTWKNLILNTGSAGIVGGVDGKHLLEWLQGMTKICNLSDILKRIK